METNNIALDEIVKKAGEITNNDAYVVINDEIIEKVDKSLDDSYAYGEIGPQPGTAVQLNTQPGFDSKSDAQQKLIQKASLFKLKKEQEAFNKKSDNEKIKEYVITSLFNQQQTEYFEKNGYAMSGGQKRKMKKIIERNYAKGKIRLTPQQKDDILYQLNLSSSTKSKNENNPLINKNSTSQNVNQLIKGI